MKVLGFRYSTALTIWRERPSQGWLLRYPYTFEVSTDLGWMLYVIPTAFSTDFASVPRLFRGIVSKIGRHAEAAVVHDWMYVARKLTAHQPGWRFERRYADDVFNAAMEEAGVGWLKRRSMWLAVRVGGGFVRGKL